MNYMNSSGRDVMEKRWGDLPAEAPIDAYHAERAGRREIGTSTTFDLVWWIQWMSWQEGGLSALAGELMEFSDKFGRSSWRPEGPSIDQVAHSVRTVATNGGLWEQAQGDKNLDICDTVDFHGLVEALQEVRRRHQAAAQEEIARTGLAEEVWRQLDFARSQRRIVLLLGDSRIGKTTAASAWCKAHAASARFVSLSGINNRRSFWAAVATALGLQVTMRSAAQQMQWRVETVLAITRMMLCFDEAHFLFSQEKHSLARPQFLDWVDSQLFNHGVPVALIATPQFRDRLRSAEEFADWNSAQFKGRSKWVDLNGVPSEEDLLKVARKMAPEASAEVIDAAVSFACGQKRALPGMATLSEVMEAAAYECQSRGGRVISRDDMKRAIKVHCVPSELVKARPLGRGARRADASPMQQDFTRPAEPLQAPGNRPVLGPESLARMAGQHRRLEAGTAPVPVAV